MPHNITVLQLRPLRLARTPRFPLLRCPTLWGPKTSCCRGERVPVVGFVSRAKESDEPDNTDRATSGARSKAQG